MKKINLQSYTNYAVNLTSSFKKNLKKIAKQGKNLNELKEIIIKLGNKNKLDFKYKNHKLRDNKYYKGCYECHINPDWLLIYKYDENNLILILVDTGSHSDLFIN